MITHFEISADKKTVVWEYERENVKFSFKYPVFANHIEWLDQVLIHSDIQESGRKNLAIYQGDGTLKCQPDMPKLKNEVTGVYAVWFVQGEKQVTVVLHSNEYRPYDTACSFDLKTCKFSKFHPTY